MTQGERVKRWWRYFREGHGNYLAYPISFFNFLTITYVLFVERFDWLTEIFPHLWMYAVVFFVLYPPLSVLVGRWHIKEQYYVEQAMAMEQGTLSARLSRITLETIQGTAKPEETQWAIDFYRKVEKR